MKGKEIYESDYADVLKEKAGESYRPSNGTEGMIFMGKYCDHCQLWDQGACEIQFHSMLYEVEEKEYPSEWIIDEDGQPTCTAFTDQ